MPELPEAERARVQIERALDREIVAVDDADTYVCRPHAPGEIAAALVGRRLTAAHRRGKFLWVETGDGGPDLGLHLGMAGRIAIDREPAPRNWDRFSIEFAGGGRLALHDKRRLGRALIEPDLSHVGPDAAEVGGDAFRTRIGRGSVALKAKLLDQGVIAGVGNLLADETLWRARLSPRRPAGELSLEELDRLRRVPALRNGARASHRRRAHDVLVPALPAGGLSRPLQPPRVLNDLEADLGVEGRGADGLEALALVEGAGARLAVGGEQAHPLVALGARLLDRPGEQLAGQSGAPPGRADEQLPEVRGALRGGLGKEPHVAGRLLGLLGDQRPGPRVAEPVAQTRKLRDVVRRTPARRCERAVALEADRHRLEHRLGVRAAGAASAPARHSARS